MADKTFLAWPFFDDGHRSLAGEFERWAANALPPLLKGSEDSSDAVYSCVGRLVAELGKAGLLRVLRAARIRRRTREPRRTQPLPGS